MTPTRKAFLVQGGDERHVIFARGHSEARRIGEAFLKPERSLVYRRVPALDRYADSGEVPVQELIERYGWSTRCRRCLHCIAPSGDEPSPNRYPVYHRNMVFCSEDCRDAEEERLTEERRRAEKAELAALARWPGIDIVEIDAHASPAIVLFRYPGGSAPARWRAGEAHASVAKRDTAAWIAFETALRN